MTALATVGKFHILFKLSVRSGVTRHWEREMPRPESLKQLWQLWTFLDLSAFSEAAFRIERELSWNDTDPQINEYDGDDEEHYEEDVDWYTGNGDEELDESAYTVGTPTDAWRSGRR